MLNVPNLLTITRIILAPVFVFLIITDNAGTALAVFIIAALTDVADGFIARRFGLRTNFGTKADPFADKFLMVCTFSALTFKGIIPVWLMLPVVIRDFALLGLVLFLKWSGREVKVRTTIPGKAATFLQAVSVLYAIIVNADDSVFTAVAALTVAFTIYTGFYYIIKELLLQYRKG
ncbi:MAG: CDP-alcohol phosphatidyltransferase family protein [Deltaproteobacteria bacterium]|nr:CDP-alcohol phosphatidyltransferase family protein [Deltaproteobacteria bacterium]